MSTSNTGRYWIVDPLTGRKFCIEPIAERGQKIDGQVFKNGGLSGNETKNDQRGGAVREEDSIINAANGFSKWITLPPGVSPNDYVMRLLREGKDVGEELSQNMDSCKNS